MIAGLQAFAFAIAAAASINGTVSWSAEMLSDSKAWWVLALVSIGALLWLKHVERSRRRRERQRRQLRGIYEQHGLAGFAGGRVIAGPGAGR